jgi:hypothetical protein
VVGDRDGREVDTGWTSVTFLLDKQGAVRYVHPGVQYVRGDPSYAALETSIGQLLAENERPAPPAHVNMVAVSAIPRANGLFTARSRHPRARVRCE